MDLVNSALRDTSSLNRINEFTTVGFSILCKILSKEMWKGKLMRVCTYGTAAYYPEMSKMKPHTIHTYTPLLNLQNNPTRLYQKSKIFDGHLFVWPVMWVIEFQVPVMLC